MFSKMFGRKSKEQIIKEEVAIEDGMNAMLAQSADTYLDSQTIEEARGLFERRFKEKGIPYDYSHLYAAMVGSKIMLVATQDRTKDLGIPALMAIAKLVKVEQDISKINV